MLLRIAINYVLLNSVYSFPTNLSDAESLAYTGEDDQVPRYSVRDDDGWWGEEGEPRWLEGVVFGAVLITHCFSIVLIPLKGLRFFSMVLYCLMWFWILYLIPCSILECSKHSEALDSIELAPYIVIPLFWLIVLFESCASTEMKYLENFGDLTYVEDFFEKMKEEVPFVRFTVTCYHYETKTRTVYETDSQGRSVTRVETYQEMVTTYVGSEAFEYTRWEDVTEDRIDIDQRGVTRVQLTKSIFCGDERTQQLFDKQYEQFRDAHRHKDVHMSAGVAYDLPNFVEHLAATGDPDAKAPGWMSTCNFLLCTCAGFSFPYRWIFNKKTSKRQFNLVKKIYK